MTDKHPLSRAYLMALNTDHDEDAVRQIAKDMADALDALHAENGRLREALEALATEHEHQADAWRDGGEPGHAKYHAKWGRFARAALNPPGVR